MSSIFSNPSEPFFMSSSFSDVGMLRPSHSASSSASQQQYHRRLPYAQKMRTTTPSPRAMSSSSFVDRYCNDIENHFRPGGVDRPDSGATSSSTSSAVARSDNEVTSRHSSITPSLEKVANSDKPRKRAFGDLLPLDVTQGGYTEPLHMARSSSPSPTGGEKTFLTPPSGMASSSSDFLTSSSSR